MTSEKTKAERTIITSSSVSIGPAAVEAPWPFQLIGTMINEITAVNASVAASIFAIGRRPNIGGRAFY